MLTITNNGKEIASTNYWQSEHAAKGYYYLSANARAFRLLVPVALEENVANEAKACKEVIISVGPWPEAGKALGFELLFEDHSSSPYCLHLSAEQADRVPAQGDAGRKVEILVYTEAGLQVTKPCRIRFVRAIPYLHPWGK